MKKIVLTRSYDDNEAFKKSVAKQAVNVCKLTNNIQFFQENMLSFPLLSIESVPFLYRNRKSLDSILVTSRHAVMALKGVNARNIPFYIVGKTTAQEVMAAGFNTIAHVAPTAEALADQIESQEYKPKNILYLRGEDVSFDFSNFLSGQGCKVRELIVYKAHKVQNFPDSFVQALQAESIGAVTFFSRRAAENFLDLVQKNELTYLMRDIKALCISQGVLESVKSLFKNCACLAKTPDSEGMLDLVVDYALNSRNF